MNELETLHVLEENAGQRIDKYASSMLEDYSRSRIQKLIEQGCVRVNNVVVDSKYKIASQDVIEINLPEPEDTELKPNPIPLDIVYEDDDIIVLNKQAGLTVHPGAGNYQDTLVNALLAYLGDNLSSVGGRMRPGIVHRLDKDTSGLMVVAKNDKAHLSLTEQLAERKMGRRYYALVWGIPSPSNGTIDTLIDRHPTNRKLMSVNADKGKSAISDYKTLHVLLDGHFSFTEWKLHTGRTHQIRVHASHIKHGIVGDPSYGGRIGSKLSHIPKQYQDVIRSFKRQALHAYSLAFIHPASKEACEFKAPLPEDMVDLIKKLDGLEFLKKNTI